jgi:hypothetical protein
MEDKAAWKEEPFGRSRARMISDEETRYYKYIGTIYERRAVK